MISVDGISSLITRDLVSKMRRQQITLRRLQNSLQGISSDSTEEELLQACKDFESYFVEEILKDVKENLTDDEEEDSSISTLTDFHMDSVIELMADELVDEVGKSFTQQLYEQMKRNYNIE